MDIYKTLLTALGLLGSLIAGMFGGWTMSLSTLCAFMAIDYFTALIVAGVFHKSPKTENGVLESNACFKGLLRKGAVLAIVFIAHRLDLEMGFNYLRDGVCIAFMANETISIIENIGLMGITVPDAIVNAIEILKKRSEEE